LGGGGTSSGGEMHGHLPMGSPRRADEVTAETADTTRGDSAKGKGGDALVSQYIGSNVTLYGGTFISGRGGIEDGHSLHATYEAQVHVFGGTFRGSWLARDKGLIVVNGCVSRIGTRLVGRLQSGHSLDVQLIEAGGGKITLNTPEKCNQYRKKPASSANGRAAVGQRLLFILCWFVPAVFSLV